MFAFTHFSIARCAAWITACVAFPLISGCATGPKTNPTDPLEPLNRKIYSFNETVDGLILKPAAIGYQSVTPRPIRMGVNNFFSNFGDFWSALNGVLQLRPVVATDSFMRFGVNSIFGLGGVLDVADDLGIERHPEDFGKTLGRWGVPSGAYVVFPILGPSTLRDSTTILIENRYDPVSHLNDIPVRNTATALRIVDTRATLLRLTNFLDDAALDKYSFTRDAFLQRRRAEIYRPGGNEDDYKPPSDEKR